MPGEPFGGDAAKRLAKLGGGLGQPPPELLRGGHWQFANTPPQLPEQQSELTEQEEPFGRHWQCPATHTWRPQQPPGPGPQHAPMGAQSQESMLRSQLWPQHCAAAVQCWPCAMQPEGQLAGVNSKATPLTNVSTLFPLPEDRERRASHRLLKRWSRR